MTVRHRNAVVASCWYLLLFFAQLQMIVDAAQLSEENRQATTLSAVDMVKMRSVIDPFSGASLYGEPTFKFSPDGKYFTIVTQEGNPKAGTMDANIVLFTTQDVRDYINNRNTAVLKGSRVLASFSSTSNSDAIRGLQWQNDSRTITFIGEKPNVPGQVFKLGVISGDLVQLTNHPRSIESYAFNDISENILYLSTLQTSNKNWHLPSYVVGTQRLRELVSRDQPYWPNAPEQLQLYVANVGSERGAKAILPPFFNYGGVDEYVPFNIWMSPNGELAAIALPSSDQAESAKWLTEYRPLEINRVRRTFAENFDEQTMQNRGGQFRQFAIIDVVHGDVKRVVNAPTASTIGGLYVKAVWQPDNSRVYLGNTFLPLDGIGDDDRVARSGSPYIAEYHTLRDTLRTVTSIEIPDGATAAPSQFIDMSLLPNGRLATFWSQRTDSAPRCRVFYDSESGWTEEKNAGSECALTSRSQSGVALSIREDLNTAPELMAFDLETGRQRQISDLNPVFKERSFGKVELFQWVDGKDRIRAGGLVYPTNYEPGIRYPLVVQLGSFHPNRFFLASSRAGHMSSAFAGQALANKEIMVLQVPHFDIGNSKAEIGSNRLAIESAIDRLNEKGLVDIQRIGLSGFSRTGFYVQELITFSDLQIAAAKVSDASNRGIHALPIFFGRQHGMSHIEGLMDSVPWGADLEKWVRSDPNMHVDFVKTPISIESNGPVISAWWGTYTTLKRLHKPVEFVQFPDGQHILRKPHEQLASQLSTVDWFDFWLNDNVRMDPYPDTPETVESLAEQYERWHKLRAQQEESNLAAIEARKAHRERSLNAAGETGVQD